MMQLRFGFRYIIWLPQRPQRRLNLFFMNQRTIYDHQPTISSPFFLLSLCTNRIDEPSVESTRINCTKVRYKLDLCFDLHTKFSLLLFFNFAPSSRALFWEMIYSRLYGSRWSCASSSVHPHCPWEYTPLTSRFHHKNYVCSCLEWFFLSS